MTKDTPTPTITGEKVFLRPMEKKDFSNYIQASRDRDLGYTAGFFVPPSRMKLEKRLETNMAENYGKTGYWFTICKLGEDESIGFVSISHLDLINGSTVLSIYLSRKELLGKGYGTDAVNAIVDFGFGQLPLERIYLFVREDNARAIRAYEKAGFTKEGTLRNTIRFEGKMVNDNIMAILRGEWLDKK